MFQNKSFAETFKFQKLICNKKMKYVKNCYINFNNPMACYLNKSKIMSNYNLALSFFKNKKIKIANKQRQD